MAINPYFNDTYDGQRYYEQQERRYREEMERQRNAAMQHAYCINTDTYRGMSAQQQQEEKPAKNLVPAYLTEKKLLLLGN